MGHHHAVLNGPTLLVIDKLEYLPLPAEAPLTLYQVVYQRYLSTPLLALTNRKYIVILRCIYVRVGGVRHEGAPDLGLTRGGT